MYESLNKTNDNNTTNKALVRKIHGNAKVKYYGHSVKDLVKDASRSFNIHFIPLWIVITWTLLLILAMIIKFGFNIHSISMIVFGLPLVISIWYVYSKKNKALREIEHGICKTKHNKGNYISNHHYTDKEVCESEFNANNVVWEFKYNVKDERNSIKYQMISILPIFVGCIFTGALLWLATHVYITNNAGIDVSTDFLAHWSWIQYTSGSMIVAMFFLYFTFVCVNIEGAILKCIRKKYISKKYKLVICESSILIPANVIYPTNIGFMEIGYDAIEDIEYKDEYGNKATLIFKLHDNKSYRITFHKNTIWNIKNEIYKRLVDQK